MLSRLYVIMFAGRYTSSTTTAAQNPPIFVDFNCGLDDYSLSDCQNPSGLTTGVYSCAAYGVVGVQCARK